MSKSLLMIDLCSGLGGASQAMRERGWQVVTVDNDQRFTPDVLGDVCAWDWGGPTPDFMWASPPCTAFSRESMPWSKTGKCPDLSIVLACKQIIDKIQPRYWVIENVRGAVPWLEPHLGYPRLIVGPFYLWGFFPLIGKVDLKYRRKESYGSSQRAERAKIPHQLSLVIALAVERQLELL